MDLVELLRRPEGKDLEFKRDLSSPARVLRTVVAFANTTRDDSHRGRGPNRARAWGGESAGCGGTSGQSDQRLGQAAPAAGPADPDVPEPAGAGRARPSEPECCSSESIASITSPTPGSRPVASPEPTERRFSTMRNSGRRSSARSKTPSRSWASTRCTAYPSVRFGGSGSNGTASLGPVHSRSLRLCQESLRHLRNCSGAILPSCW